MDYLYGTTLLDMVIITFDYGQTTIIRTNMGTLGFMVLTRLSSIAKKLAL